MTSRQLFYSVQRQWCLNTLSYINDRRVTWILTTASYCHIFGTEQICNCRITWINTCSLNSSLLTSKSGTNRPHTGLMSVFASRPTVSLRVISHNTAAFEDNCVKFNEARPTLSVTQMQPCRESSFRQYVVCGGLRR